MPSVATSSSTANTMRLERKVFLPRVFMASFHTLVATPLFRCFELYRPVEALPISWPFHHVLNTKPPQHERKQAFFVFPSAASYFSQELLATGSFFYPLSCPLRACGTKSPTPHEAFSFSDPRVEDERRELRRVWNYDTGAATSVILIPLLYPGLPGQGGSESWPV